MKVGRNDPCPCGSGRKYKHCCLEKERGGIPLTQRLMLAGVGLLLLMGIGAIALTLSNDESRSSSGERVWSEEHQHWHDVP